MRMDRSGMSRKLFVSALLLSGLCLSSGWADGFTNIDNAGYQRVYSDQGGNYPQYYGRIEPNTSPSYAQQNYQYPPLRASTTATHPHKALSTKIADGFADLWHTPSVRSGVAGAGIGLGTAALTKHMGLWHGTWVGAAYGAGFGLMDELNFFKKHPLMRRTAKGAVVGLGAAAVSGAAALGPAAAVGAGVGAGIHLLKNN